MVVGGPIVGGMCGSWKLATPLASSLRIPFLPGWRGDSTRDLRAYAAAFLRNTAEKNGGAFYLQGSAAAVLANGTDVDGNSATEGGGAFLTDSANVVVSGTVVKQNDAKRGGGIALHERGEGEACVEVIGEFVE